MHYLVVYMRHPVLLVAVLLSSAVGLGSCGTQKPNPSTTDAIVAGFAELRLEAGSVITDSLRREKFLHHSRALEVGLRSFEQTAQGLIEQYRSAFTNYDADQNSLSRIAAEYREQYQQAGAQFVASHLAMAASVTAEEWKPLAKTENKLLKEVREAAARSLE